MKKLITKSFLKLNNIFLNNWKYFLGILISMTVLLYSSTLIPIPFDKQCENEIASLIKTNAMANEYGYSLNSIEMKRTGNSDYWIYSSNELQNFQMRNQQFHDTRSYVFCAYKPTGGLSPFTYDNINCTSILFESKFEDNNFYFDLPLLYGKLPRYVDKNSIFITDTFAKRISNISNENLSSLIDKTLIGKSICSNGTSDQLFKIIGIFNTNNNLGKFLKAAFGDNIIFVSEYNSYQMNGSLYFCGSNSALENELMVNFVYNKYKSTKNASRDLAVGYDAFYNFYDFNSKDNSFVLSSSNDKMNSILNKYENQAVLFSLLGVLLFVASSALIIASSCKQIKRNAVFSKTLFILIVWIASCFSLFLNSILYAYAPLMSLVSGQSFSTHSVVISSVLFLTWIVTVLILTIMFSAKSKSN